MTRLSILLTALFLSPFLSACVHLTTSPQAASPGDLQLGAIASAHPLATEAGFEILAAGGNAFDAAVAVSATLAVVEPAGSGMGGGGFWLLHQSQSGRQVFVDGREVAPLAATADMYLDASGNELPRSSLDGPLAAGIPGQPAALDHIAKRYGRLPLARSLQPAIRAARDGFVVDNAMRQRLQYRQQVMRQWPATAAIFLPQGQLPAAGTVLPQTDLANTLQLMAQRGAAGFYQGEVAEQLVKAVRQAGGIWTAQDLANYRVLERQPVIAEYRDYRIVSAPPPSSGGIALTQMFNMLSLVDLDNLSPVQRYHQIIEVMRRAYRDRAQYLGDSDFVPVPQDWLTSRRYAQKIAASINTEQATASTDLPAVLVEAPQGQDTTHFSVIDTEGNRVAATLSINFPFGSGFVAAGTGVLLNNEMDDFSKKPGVPNGYGLVHSHANSIAPGKRMLSSMTPTFIEKNDDVLVLGTPGGSRIISMVFLAALEWMHNGRGKGVTAKQLVALPRFHHQYLPDIVTYEHGAFSADQQAALIAMGHTLKQRSRPYGNMQAVLQKNGKDSAASDPRGLGKGVAR